MKKQIKLKPYHVPNIILKIVVVLVLAGYLYMETMSVGFLLSNPAPFGNGQSDYWLWVTDITPVVAFALAYFMNPRRLNIWARSFESLLLTLIGMVIMTITSMLASFLPGRNESSYIIQASIGSAVGLLAFAGLLYWMRRSKRWA